jgi:hypothetical protein
MYIDHQKNHKNSQNHKITIKIAIMINRRPLPINLNYHKHLYSHLIKYLKIKPQFQFKMFL